jgi:hypothetical protein
MRTGVSLSVTSADMDRLRNLIGSLPALPWLDVLALPEPAGRGGPEVSNR